MTQRAVDWYLDKMRQVGHVFLTAEYRGGYTCRWEVGRGIFTAWGQAAVVAAKKCYMKGPPEARRL